MATIGDVVLIYYKDQSFFFARIESIEPDIKKGWFKVQLLILAIPLRTVTWILRKEYLNGIPFTMEGNPVRIEAVKPLPVETYSHDTEEKLSEETPPQKGRKIIPFRKYGRDSATET
jgi:hypothetical protein